MAGGKVLLSEGAFEIDAPIDAVSGLILQGQGYATQLVTVLNGTIVRASSVDNIVVRDMRLTGSGAGGGQCGVTLTIVNNCHIEGLYVEDMGYDGIQVLYGGHRVVVIDNWVDNCGDDGINVGGGTSPATADVVVSNNHVTGCTSTGIHLSWGSSDLSVFGNIIVGCAYGIDMYLEPGHGAEQRAIIFGNVVRDSANHGITVDGNSAAMTDVAIIANVVKNSADQGIRVTANGVRFLIANNIIRDAANYGIILSSGTGNADRDVSIIGNILSGECGTVGINMWQYSNVLVLNNTVLDITGPDAIKENGCSGALIMGNKVEDNIVAGGAATVVRNNMGFVTENSGTGTIPSAGPPASVVIAHGCDYTPNAADIVITLTENPTNTPGAVWVDTIGAANFTVNCENDPGASALDFSWAVRRV